MLATSDVPTVIDRPIVVLSLPKAGTYLVSELLARCGRRQTYWHVREDSMEDYSAGAMEERRRYPKRFTKPVPLNEVVRAAPAGSFFVGHIACHAGTLDTLGPCPKVLAVRELRAALVSLLRFEQRLRRSPVWAPVWEADGDRPRAERFLELMGEGLIGTLRAIAEWHGRSDVTTVRFEDLLAGVERGYGPIAETLSLAPTDVAAALRASLAADTLTKSPGPAAAMSDFWSDRCEDLFRRFGGDEINRRLGYPGDAPGRAA